MNNEAEGVLLESVAPKKESVVWKFSEGQKASTFCMIMPGRYAPESFNQAFIAQLVEWRLMPGEELSMSMDYSAIMPKMWDIREKAESMPTDFIVAFRQHPWNFDWSLEAPYRDDELESKFPRGLELANILGGGTKFLFRSEPGSFHLRIVERTDGRRQVIREIETRRSVEEINADAALAPSVVPRFEAVQFKDGKTGLLIDWIDGHIPTGEEKGICLTAAEQLLQIGMDSYDLWAGNFVVDNKSGLPFYIDRDIPEAIATFGYSEVDETRKAVFERSKEKMK